MYNGFTLLPSRNQHNIVNQLYSKKINLRKEIHQSLLKHRKGGLITRDLEPQVT